MINAESGMHLIYKNSEFNKKGEVTLLEVKLLRVIAWTDIGSDNQSFPVVIEQASYSNVSSKWVNKNTTISAYVLHHMISSDNSAESLFFSVDNWATLNDVFHLANSCLNAARWNIPLIKTNNTAI